VADCKTVQSCAAVYDRGCLKIAWYDVNAMDYRVEYRRKGASSWYTGRNARPGLCEIYSLRPGVEYEYRIGTRCVINDEFGYSDVKAFRIPDREDRSPECGILPDVSLNNRTPASELLPDMPVKAGDFPVFITKVSGSGTFSGEGFVGIPYLRNVRVAVTFNNIVVNTDNQLISGYFETMYDAEYQNLLTDVDEALTGGGGLGDIRYGEERAAFDVDYIIDPCIPAKPTVADNGEDPVRDANGDYVFAKGENGMYEITLTDDKGNEHIIESEKLPFTLKDGSGNTYEIGENGTAKPVSSASGIRLPDEGRETPHPELAVLQFEETPNTRYALDQYRDVYAKVTEYFLKYKPTNDEMIASAKFLTPGVSDEIFVRILSSGEGFTPAKVHFVTDKGQEYNGVYDESKNGWTLTLAGGLAGDGQRLYAVMETASGMYATLARLNIYTYAPKNVNVKLIPVNGFTNGFTTESVSQRLNAIYNRVGVTCEVEMATNFDYEPLKAGAFNVTGSGLFSTLTDDMKALNGAFLDERPDETDLCLFLIENVTGADGITGDMPRGCQFGYLFEGATALTVAHEIGHGLFRLEHPFERANAATSFDSGDLSENVMEYPPHDGDRFVKLQWDAIHAPGLVIGFFETDDDAMARAAKEKDFYITVDGIMAIKFDGKVLDDEFKEIKKILSDNSSLNRYPFKTIPLYLLNTDGNDHILSSVCIINGKVQRTTDIVWDAADRSEKTKISFANNNDIVIYMYYSAQVGEYIRTAPVYTLHLKRVTPNIAYRQLPTGNTGYIIKEENINTGAIELSGATVSLRPLFLTAHELVNGVKDTCMEALFERNERCLYMVDSIMWNGERRQEENFSEWMDCSMKRGVSNTYKIITGNSHSEGVINNINAPFVTVKRGVSNTATGYYIEDYYSTELHAPPHESLRELENSMKNVHLEGLDRQYRIPIVHYKSQCSVKLALSNISAGGNNSNTIRYMAGERTIALGEEFTLQTPPHGGAVMDIEDSDGNIRGKIEFRQFTEQELSPVLNIVTVDAGIPDGYNFSDVINDLNSIYNTMNVSWRQRRHINLAKDIKSGKEENKGKEINIKNVNKVLKAHKEYKENEYYMILMPLEEGLYGFTWGLGKNYFCINSTTTLSTMLEEHMAVHELGHCNGLDEIAINIGEKPADEQSRNELLAGSYNDLQRSSSNVMGYRRKTGADKTPPTIDFYSWQIPLLRNNIKAKISTK
jgi:hypothetical protein